MVRSLIFSYGSAEGLRRHGAPVSVISRSPCLPSKPKWMLVPTLDELLLACGKPRAHLLKRRHGHAYRGGRTRRCMCRSTGPWSNAAARLGAAAHGGGRRRGTMPRHNAEAQRVSPWCKAVVQRCGIAAQHNGDRLRHRPLALLALEAHACQHDLGMRESSGTTAARAARYRVFAVFHLCCRSVIVNVSALS
jgi:hypothetical protein